MSDPDNILRICHSNKINIIKGKLHTMIINPIEVRDQRCYCLGISLSSFNIKLQNLSYSPTLCLMEQEQRRQPFKQGTSHFVIRGITHTVFHFFLIYLNTKSAKKPVKSFKMSKNSVIDMK